MKETFTLGNFQLNTIEDFPVGRVIRDWAAGADGQRGVVVGYPVIGGFPESIPFRIEPVSHGRQKAYPLVITKTDDNKYHVRSIRCQEVVL